MNQNRNKIPQLLKRLYEIVAELELLFPGRKFTPDGHLVGSLGEVIAAHDYDLILLESSAETHDARKGSKQIQIKATQGKSEEWGRWFKYNLTLIARRSSIGRMPRQARLDAPGTLHHVMARGIEGTDIFRTDKDRNDFLDRSVAQC